MKGCMGSEKFTVHVPITFSKVTACRKAPETRREVPYPSGKIRRKFMEGVALR